MDAQREYWINNAVWSIGNDLRFYFDLFDNRIESPAVYWSSAEESENYMLTEGWPTMEGTTYDA